MYALWYKGSFVMYQQIVVADLIEMKLIFLSIIIFMKLNSLKCGMYNHYLESGITPFYLIIFAFGRVDMMQKTLNRALLI